jgi:hypothetical protein
MAAEMTPRPEIQITDEEDDNLDLIDRRKLHIEHCLMDSSLLFDSIFEAWRRVHEIRVGKRCDWPTRADYEDALRDPDPYDTYYIFYCLKKLSD